MVDLRNRTALLVPSYRKTPQVLANLAYLAALSSPEIHVWISDCSTDREKQGYLKRLKKQHPFLTLLLHDERVPLYRDVAATMNDMDSYTYVSMCADDDYVSLPYLQDSIALLENNDACVCSLGNYMLWLNGSFLQGAGDIRGSSPVARLEAGFNPSSFNRLFFAVFRRSAMRPWINFCNGHPLIGAFFDAIHTCALLAQGEVRYQPNGFYLWTGENWDTPAENLKARRRYYQDAGLPGEFAVFHDLHFAIEGINFFVGEHCPISNLGTRLACAQTIWSRCMETFRNDVKKGEETYTRPLAASPLALEAFSFLLQKANCDDQQILSAFEAILAVFSESLAERYGSHFRASLARAKVT